MGRYDRSSRLQRGLELMKLAELKNQSHELLSTKFEQKENVLNIYNMADNNLKFTFTFDTEKECTIAKCELINCKLAESLVHRTAEIAAHMSAGNGKTIKTGFKR